MDWILPGTTLQAQRTNADQTCELFQSLFLAGGLTLSQVASITGLESYTIQNWVKRRFLPPPQNKRYNMEQLCRILNINILKGPLPIEQITKLLAYLNGDLADESDDLVDDTMLYFMFVRLAARARHLGGTTEWEDALLEVTETYQEPIPGARGKLIQVLRIMLTAWCANRLQQQAENMIQEIQ